MYASNSHSYTHLILPWISLESLQYESLLLQNILAYMTLAGLPSAPNPNPEYYASGISETQEYPGWDSGWE